MVMRRKLFGVIKLRGGKEQGTFFVVRTTSKKLAVQAYGKHVGKSYTRVYTRGGSGGRKVAHARIRVYPIKLRKR